MTDQQLQLYRQQFGINPADIKIPGSVNPAGSNTPTSRLDEFRSALAGSTGNQEPSLGSRIKTDLQARGQEAKQAITEDTGESDLTKGVKATAAVAGGIGDIGGEILKSILGKDIVDKVGGGISKAFEGYINSPYVQKQASAINQWIDQNPEAGKNLLDKLQLAKSGGDIAQNILAFEGGKKVTTKGAETFGKGAEATTKEIASTAGETGRALQESAKASEQAAKEKFVNDLIQKEETQASKTANIKQQGKVKEGGFISPRETTLSPYEKELAQTVHEVPGIDSSKSILENKDLIHEHIGTLAEELKTQLKDQPSFFSPSEFKGFMKTVTDKIKGNSFLSSAAVKQANKFLSDFEGFVKKNGYTPEGLLEARKDFDTFIRENKPKTFNPDRTDALTTVLKEIRSGGNEFLAKKAPNIQVKELLRKQANLYQVIDRIAPKAAKEAKTGLGRMLQKTGLGKARSQLGGIAGLEALDVMSHLVPGLATTVAKAGGAILGTKLLYKGLKAPVLRKKLGDTLVAVEKALKENPESKPLQDLKKNLTSTE